MRNIIILLFISSGTFAQKVITQATVIDLPDSLLSKEQVINPPNTIKKYINGYKQFVSFNSDSIPEGSTNFYYTNAHGLGTVLTGYVSGAGTVASTDNILQAIQKLNGNDGLKANLISPSFTTPSLGVATATSINGNILTTGSSTYTGTAGQTYTFPTTTATIARTDAAQTFTGTQTFSGTILNTGGITTSGVFAGANFWANAASSGTGLTASQSTSQYMVGANNAQFRVGIRGATSTVATAGTDVWAFLVGNNAFTEATSGTSALSGGVGILTQTFTNGSGATTDFNNLYVGDKPTGGINNWSANLGETLIREKLNVTTGSNKSIGVSGAMTAGTITISTTAVTANSKIFLVHATIGGTQGILSVGTITAGTSFVINSSNAADTGTVNWWIIN